jgi:hypothetical protein
MMMMKIKATKSTLGVVGNRRVSLTIDLQFVPNFTICLIG